MKKEKRILMIDDDQRFRRKMKKILLDDNAAYNITEADTYENLLIKLKENEFDLILSELSIQGNDISELVFSIRHFNPALPIIIITDRGNVEIAVKAMKAGVTDYTIKSFKGAAKILDNIRAALEKFETIEKNNQQGFYTKIRDQKEKEEELTFRNHLLTTLLDVSLHGILVVDENKNILFHNKRFLEMMNNPGDLQTKSDLLLVDHVIGEVAEPDRFISRINSIYENKKESSFDEIEFKNGKILERYSSPIVGKEGRYFGRIWYFRDITSRRRSETELRKSEWKHRIVADNTYDWEYWLDNDRSFVYCSPSCLRISGYTASEFLADSTIMELIVYHDDIARYETHIKTEELEDNPLEFKYRIVHKDGSVRWLAHICQPIIDEKGKKMGRRGTNRDITVQMSAEEAIRKSESRFRSYFDLSIAGFAITSPDKKWLEVNEYLCLMLGYSKAELTNLTWFELTHPDDINLDLNHFNRLMEGEIEGYTIDKRFLRKDGMIIWTSMSIRCIRQNDGKVESVLALLVDITERKKASEELQKKTSELELMLDNMHNAFVIWESVFDESGNYVSFCFNYFNNAYARSARIKLEEVRGKNVFEVWPDTELSWVEVYKQVAITGIPNTFDMYHATTRGWYHCNAYRPTDSSKIICVIMENITSRKVMEEKLAWEQHLMVTLLNNIPDYIYFKDLESRFLRINKALSHVFGLNDPLMAIGKSDFDFFQTEHSTEAYNDEQNIIKTGIPLVGKEEREVWADRPYTWVSTTKMPLVDSDGKTIGTFGISRDITEKKKSQEDLEKAKAKAEEGDRLKTAFLQNISHEIRTPLNAITGFVSLLNKPDLPVEKKEEFIRIINVSCDQLLAIISGIISLSTLDAGQEKITENVTVLNDLLINVYDQLMINFDNPNVILTYHSDVSVDKSTVYIDSAKLMQVMVNLVGNALKFTPEGFVEYGFRIKEDLIEFYITDSGIGIPEDMHDSVFERFRQVDNTSTRKYGGNGLGLAISKGYVELMGGKISLTSSPGKGSTFSFRLPYSPVSKSDMASNTDSQIVSDLFSSMTKILIAEDDTTNYLLLKEILTSESIKLVRATNGIEALEICRNPNPPDLVLMDIKMPLMDGFEAIKRIRETEPELPIVALTGYASEMDKNKIYESGFSGYIEKPIQLKFLYETLIRIVNKK